MPRITPAIVASALLLGVLLIAPWLFGGVVYQYRVYLAAAVALATAITVIMGDSPVQTTRLGKFLLASLAFGVFTLLPLPLSVVKTVSPNTASWHQQAADAMGEQPPNFIPFTLNAANTRRDLAHWGLAILFYFTAVTLVREPWKKEWVLWAIAVAGTAYAIFAVVQQMNWNGYFYWRIPITGGGEPFGAFYSRNQGAGYLLIPLACTLGLLMPRLAAPSMLKRSIGEVVGLVAMAAVIGSSIPISQSRGATLAAGTALLVLAFTEGWRNRGRILPLLAASVLILLCGYGISWLGQTEDVRDRLATLTTAESVKAEGRLKHWPVAYRAFQEYPIFGAGQGAHAYVYRPLLDYDEYAWFVHAENQYLETIVHTGIIGGLLLLGMLGLISLNCRRAYREPGGANQAVAAMSLFLVVGVATHSVFDFFVYAPAVLWTVMFLIGLTEASITAGANSGGATGSASAAGATNGGAPTSGGSTTNPKRQFWPASTMPVILLVIAISAVHETSDRAEIEKAIVDSNFQLTPDPNANRYGNPQLPKNLEAEPLEDAIFDLKEAVRRVPDDSEALYRLARCQINRYQLAIAGDFVAQNRGTDVSIWWPITSTTYLHGRIAQLRRTGEDEAIDKLFNSLPVTFYLEPAWQNLKRAQRANPLHARTNAYLAELTPLFAAESGKTKTNQNLTRLAALTSPWSEDMQYRCGLVELQAERVSEGLAYWRRSLEISGRHQATALQWLETVAPQEPDQGASLYAKLIPNNPSLKLSIANRKTTPASIRESLLNEANTELTQRKATPENAHLQAQINWAQGNRTSAISHLKDAIKGQPNNFKWRTNLANWLIAENKPQEAAQQVKAGLNLSPYDAPLRDLAEKLNITSTQ